MNKDVDMLKNELKRKEEELIFYKVSINSVYGCDPEKARNNQSRLLQKYSQLMDDCRKLRYLIATTEKGE